MAFDGECKTQLFFLISENTNPSTSSLPLAVSRFDRCCLETLSVMTALADASDADTFKNDYHRPVFPFDDSISATVMTLEKYDGANWNLVATLNNNALGTYYAFGYETNEQGQIFTSYHLDWRAVLIAHSVGRYRIKCVATTFTGTIEVLDHEYQLKRFSEREANKTVKIEWANSGKFGDFANDEKIKDYGNQSIQDMMRLPGYFGMTSGNYEEERNKYNNGQRKYVKDEQEPEYTLKLRMVSGLIHEIMRVEVMMSNSISITDYNTDNPLSYIQKRVYKSSSYAPEWLIYKSKLANVELKFKQEFNRLKKLRC